MSAASHPPASKDKIQEADGKKDDQDRLYLRPIVSLTVIKVGFGVLINSRK
jgi:hypothetical protein